MNSLEKYFINNKGRYIHKWWHYFDIYHRYFQRFRDEPVNLLEIGVSHGGSLEMWRDYFHPTSKIVGIDINQDCKEIKKDGFDIWIGNQTDVEFLADVVSKYEKFDIIIDDGGHFMEQQKASFNFLYKYTKRIYLVEDTHTSYWAKWGGGIGKPDTYIEDAKTYVDKINSHHWESENEDNLKFAAETLGIHFYDSVVVFEKRQRPYKKPCTNITGRNSCNGKPCSLGAKEIPIYQAPPD